MMTTDNYVAHGLEITNNSVLKLVNVILKLNRENLFHGEMPFEFYKTASYSYSNLSFSEH